MRTQFLVIGAGCAGLSLAVHLARSSRDFDLTIVDQRTSFGRDRTWCFWPTEPHPFEECVEMEWESWTVSNRERSTTQKSERFPYQMIPSDSFYDQALEVIKQDERMELLLDTEIETLEESTRNIRASNGQIDIQSDVVFDSRPVYNEDPLFFQHFLGWFIEAEAPIFDSSRVRLMDFWKDTDHGQHFMYQLPLSSRRSLFEATWISDHPLERSVYEQTLENYLETSYDNLNYEIYRQEQGAIPLDLSPQTPCSRRIIPIGSAGGATRPSTGYTFLGIQRASRSIAASVTRGTQPAAPRIWSQIALLLDNIFMSYLERYPERGPELFFNLFSHTDTESLVKFLSDRASLRDYFDVMFSMPKLEMMKELMYQISKSSGNSGD